MLLKPDNNMSMTEEEEMLIGDALIHAIYKTYPAIIERAESKKDKQEGALLINSLD